MEAWNIAMMKIQEYRWVYSILPIFHVELK